MMLLEAIKGYYTEENVVFLTGDVVKVIEMEEGSVMLEGVAGWCKDVILDFSPKIVATHFKAIHLKYTI